MVWTWQLPISRSQHIFVTTLFSRNLELSIIKTIALAKSSAKKFSGEISQVTKDRVEPIVRFSCSVVNKIDRKFDDTTV